VVLEQLARGPATGGGVSGGLGIHFQKNAHHEKPVSRAGQHRNLGERRVVPSRTRITAAGLRRERRRTRPSQRGGARAAVGAAERHLPGVEVHRLARRNPESGRPLRAGRKVRSELPEGDRASSGALEDRPRALVGGEVDARVPGAQSRPWPGRPRQRRTDVILASEPTGRRAGTREECGSAGGRSLWHGGPDLVLEPDRRSPRAPGVVPGF